MHSKPFLLDTDASDVGIGAVLSQIQDNGSEGVIAYASRSLSRQEQKYCVTRKELLAVVEFTHHFRPYLLGKKFTLRTDHSSLIWMQNFKEPEGQLARWLEKLQEYDFSILHRQGSRHSNADALSRIPCRQCGRGDLCGKIVDEVCAVDAVLPYIPQTNSLDEVRRMQAEDNIVGPVLEAVERGKVPEPDVSKSWSRESRLLLQQWDTLICNCGVLWRCVSEGKERRQLVLPYRLYGKVIQDLHEGAVGAHLGEEKVLSQLKERFYWPGCTEAVKTWCRSCTTCASRKMTTPARKAELHTIQTGYPMQMVSVDIMGPLPETQDGCKYVLVAIDHFTRWAEVYAIKNQEATTVSKKLVDEMFCRFSPPEQLHSDQGRQFESELLAEVCSLLKVRKSHTTPYHPQGNGMVEWFNRTLLSMLATVTHDHPGDWEQHIRKVCLAYISSVHSATGFSPFFLMFGREAKLPVDLMYGSNRIEERCATEYAHNLREGLQSAYALVREHCKAEHRRQKDIYDEKVHGKPFVPGELVWLHSPAVPRGQSRKLHLPWKGPLKVLERRGDCVYKIARPRGKKPQWVHFDRLKPYVGRDVHDQNDAADNHFSAAQQTSSRDDNSQSATTVQQPVGQSTIADELLDDDDEQPTDNDVQDEDGPAPVPDPRRYPTRDRRIPERYGPYLQH